jgi:alanine transaminase
MSVIHKAKIDESTINPLVKAASYAVRGKIVTRAAQLSERLKNSNDLPFKKIISCNIGNPHALNQKPITFLRDVLSLVINPSLKDKINLPSDVIHRAERYLANIPGLGAYSESQGLQSVRDDIAVYLKRRDGFEGNPANIFLTNGASEGVRLCMQTIIRDPTDGYRDGILTPIPQYPLYSALTTLLEGTLVPYYLDESRGWSCSVNALQGSLDKAKIDGITTRCLVVINPGNPTGQILSEGNMREIVEFCVKEGICLMADEVYQENVWKKNTKFVSFRKVAHDMGLSPDSNDLQMVSFHSISKVSEVLATSVLIFL